MAVSAAPAEQRVYLRNVSWSTYLALVRDVDNPGGRICYDQGELEIMSPSAVHEIIKTLLGRMIEVFTLEHNIDVCSAGSTTLKRADLQKGLEADECYYLQDAARVQGFDTIDLAVHPAPNLAIEVDISRSSRMKLDIFAALGVNEVWRFDGAELSVMALHDDAYQVQTESRVLPGFPLDEAARLIGERLTTNETALIRSFQQKVRERIANP